MNKKEVYIGQSMQNGPREICGWHPLKNLNWYDVPKQAIRYEIFLKAVFHSFYLSIIECLDSSLKQQLLPLSF